MSHEEQDVREDLDFVPIYRMSNPVEAMFLKEVFDTEKIINVFNNLQMSAFPTDVGEQGEIVALVDRKDYNRAKELIDSALENKAITTEGAFVDSVE